MQMQMQTTMDDGHDTETPTSSPVTTRQPAPAQTWRLDAAQVEATWAKINRINGRSKKKALTGQITMAVTPVEVTTMDSGTGFAITTTEYNVTLGGEAPSYNGWQFIATLDWDQHAGLIVRAVPGAAVVDRGSLRQGWCSHCKAARTRRLTYVVRNMDTGEQLQVGRSCIKDFTGWHGTVALLETPTDPDWFGKRGAPEASPETVLAIAWACTKKFGFHPASSQGGGTAALVRMMLNPDLQRSPDDRRLVKELRPLAEEARQQAREILAWLLSPQCTGGGDYMLNLKSVAAGTRVSTRNIGLIASAPQAYARHQESSLRRQQEAANSPSRWIGQTGERLEVTVTVKSVRYPEHGPFVVYTLVDEDGNVLRWPASSDALGDKAGVRTMLTGTVKAHETWQGLKYTVLTRCRVGQHLSNA